MAVHMAQLDTIEEALDEIENTSVGRALSSLVTRSKAPVYLASQSDVPPTASAITTPKTQFAALVRNKLLAVT